MLCYVYVVLRKIKCDQNIGATRMPPIVAHVLLLDTILFGL